MKKTTLETIKTTVEKLASEGAYVLNVSNGNKKLVSNEQTRFIVWNLPAVITCPYATEMCKSACYARKAERVYPTCLPSRQRNFDESRKQDFVKNMIYTILKTALKSKAKNIVVRIHESGDFYNNDYAKKWLEIANACRIDKRIKFIAYTKSFKYFDGVALPSNFSLRASIWDDTSEAQREIVTRNGWNIYTAVDKFQTGDTFTRCDETARTGAVTVKQPKREGKPNQAQRGRRFNTVKYQRIEAFHRAGFRGSSKKTQ